MVSNTIQGINVLGDLPSMESYHRSVNILHLLHPSLFLRVNSGEILLGPCKVTFKVGGKREGYISAAECNNIPRCCTCLGTYVHLTDVFMCTNPGRLQFVR